MQSPGFGSRVENNDLFIFSVSLQTSTRMITLGGGFQQGSISKLATGVGPKPQDEGKPMPSGIWETVTMLVNEDTGYGLLE